MQKNRFAIMMIVLTSYLMIVLDISFVITALPKIQEDIGFSIIGISWVQNIYTLVFGGLLLLGARAGDLLGQKRMFLIGLLIFSISSLAISLVQNPIWMLVFRGFQGLGGAILAPTELALLSTHFPEGEERTRAFAFYGAVAGVGASFGFVLGGIFASWFSWRIGFVLNLTMGFLLLALSWKYISETKQQSGEFDFTGAFTSTSGMIAFTYGIVRSASVGWTDRLTISVIFTGIIFLSFFLYTEWKAKQPILPLRLFQHLERNGAYLSRMLYISAMMAFWFFTTQYLQNILGMTAFLSGLAFLPMSIPNFAFAMFVPRLTKAIGNEILLFISIGITLIGMYWLSLISIHTSYLNGVFFPMILLGIGQGGAISSLTVSGLVDIPKEDAGAASGLVNATHRVGGSLGLAILVVIFSTAKANNLDPRELLTYKISCAFFGGVVMLTLAFIIVFLCIVLPKYLNRSHP